MPDYLEEPSEEEIKLTESMRDAETQPPEEQPEAEQEGAGEEEVSEGASEGAEEKPDQPKVNLGALHEARAQNKELRGELGQARERMAAMEGRLGQILERIESEGEKPQVPVAERGPSYEEDPEGYYKHQIDSMRQEIDGLKGAGKQTQEQAEQAEEHQQDMARYRAAAQEYGQKQADFMDAYEWLAGNIDAELRARGFSDPLERQKIMAQEEFGMARMAMKAGADPAERLYELAKHRGYKPEAAEQPDKLVNLEKVKGKAKSLSNAGGGPDNAGTLEQLSQLEGAEFDAGWEKLRRAGKLG